MYEENVWGCYACGAVPGRWCVELSDPTVGLCVR